MLRGYPGSQGDVTRNSDYKREIKLQLRHTSFSLSVCLLIYPRRECGFHHVIYFKLRLDAFQETVGQVQVVWLVVGVTGCTLGASEGVPSGQRGVRPSLPLPPARTWSRLLFHAEKFPVSVHVFIRTSLPGRCLSLGLDEQEVLFLLQKNLALGGFLRPRES